MRFPYVFLLSACALMLALPLAAQSTNGVINGLVVDPSNRTIAGADILVINDATGVRYSSKTNEDGIYVVPNLPPGAYRLQVSRLGFKTLIKPDIVLNIQDALSINFTLPVGAVFESVTVEGGASMINTTDASVSTVIDHTYVENMPLNGRSFQDLILLTPGIVTQSPQASSGISGLGVTGEFSVNGQRTEENYYTVDGVSANVGAASGFAMISGAGPSGSLSASTALGTTQALVSVDDLQEFRVNSSTYSAEYGRNPGGQFAFETKSGTNQWHGSAYDYVRNNFFDANDWFNDYLGAKEPPTRQNDFGGTFGGLVKIPGVYNGRDKTFFFLSYEGLRLTQPQPAATIFVPDATLRANTPVPLNQVLNSFPIQSPNGIDDVANGVAQFIGSWSNPSSINSTSVRLDHAMSNKLKLFFRFSNTGSSSSARGTTWGVPQNVDTRAYTSRTYTPGATTVLTSRFSNDVRFNYSSNLVASSSVIEPFGGSAPVSLLRLTGLGPDAGPNVDIEYGPYFIGIGESRLGGAQKQWNLVDTVSIALGRHQFKFGMDYRRLTPLTTFDSPEVSYYYLSESEVEANNPSYVFSKTLGSAYPLYVNFSAFAEDEWKVSRCLRLSFGIRWDVNPPPGVTRGLEPYTLQGTGPNNWSLAPEGTPLWHTTWYNFAPRLGLAYILRFSPGWETVVRGGGGVFFDTGQQLGSFGFSGPGFSQFGPLQSLSFPTLPIISNIVNPPVAPYQDPEGFATHLQLPYTLQWNASIEQALGNSQALTASYVGSHAARLLQQNQFQSSVNPNNPNGVFFFNENGLTSDYDSLQVQFRRRLSRGLTALASYTWSHCIDYGSTNFDIGYQRGNCDFDVRHNFSTAFSYQLPNVGHGEVLNAVLHHWGLDDRFTARTAFPVNISGGTVFDPVTEKAMSAGADLVSSQQTYLYSANCNSAFASLYGNTLPCPGGRAINPCAFVVPGSLPGPPCTTNGRDGTVLGLAPRNFVRGFNAWQMDLAVRREFPIYENLKLQFRAEAFNIFNHPNFGIINTNIGQSTFGQPTATLANSLGILSPLYQMGGPRSMQFALKLVF
jgi:hypothetical protein